MILNTINKTEYVDVKEVQSINCDSIIGNKLKMKIYATINFKNSASISVQYNSIDELREDINTLEALKHE